MCRSVPALMSAGVLIIVWATRFELAPAVVAMTPCADGVQVPPPVMHQVGKLTYDDRPQCPGVPDVQPEQLPPVDPRVNFLMILGAQKAGTTWLFDALDTHPLFNGANHGFRSALSERMAAVVHVMCTFACCLHTGMMHFCTFQAFGRCAAAAVWSLGFCKRAVYWWTWKKLPCTTLLEQAFACTMLQAKCCVQLTVPRIRLRHGTHMQS